MTDHITRQNGWLDHKTIRYAVAGTVLIEDDMQTTVTDVDTKVTTGGAVVAYCETPVASGDGAPSSTPTKVGDRYVDTTGGVMYFAKGTSSSADWVALANA